MQRGHKDEIHKCCVLLVVCVPLFGYLHQIRMSDRKRPLVNAVTSTFDVISVLMLATSPHKSDCFRVKPILKSIFDFICMLPAW